MYFHHQPAPAIIFSLVSVIIIICAPSATGSWEERDGIKMEVPKRMAKLLMRITKQKLNSIKESIRNGQINSMANENIQTVLTRMNLNGLQIRYPVHEKRNLSKILRLSSGDKIGNRRLQRRAVFHGRSKKAKVCSSAKMYVNLTKYTNIVVPSGFETVYCDKVWYPIPIGNDPVTKIISKAILETINKIHNFSKPVFKNSDCCVPSKAKNLVVLYNDAKNNYSMIKYVPKAIIRSCECPLG